MKRSVKIISLFVSVVMLLNLCGCTITIGGGSEKTTAETTADTAASTAKPTAKKTAAKKTKAPTAKAAAKPQHQHTYYEEIVEGTCKKQGYSVFTCSCGDSYKANYVNGEHQYKDYVCTVCGAIDKGNAYGYLKSFLKKNGELDRQYIVFNDTQWEGDVYKSSTLGYDVGGDYIFAALYLAYQGESQSIFVTFNTYQYFLYIDDELRQEGIIPAKDFTDKYPLPYTEVIMDNTEDYGELANINEDARQAVCVAIEETARHLKENNVGITIADLGFTSYKV